MKTIIAGSRAIKDWRHVHDAISLAPWKITEVISGCAPGVDTLGEEWARAFGVPIRPFPAAWDDIMAPGAVIRAHAITGKPYNARAGFDRNEEMAKYAALHAGALIAIWNGHSTGTADMIQRAERHRLTHIFKHRIL